MGCWISHDLLQVFFVFWNANFQISTPNHMKWHPFWSQLEVDFAGWFFRGSSVILLSNLGGRKMNVIFWGSPGVASSPNKHPFGVGKMFDKIWITRKKNVSKLETTPNKLLFVQKQSPQLLRWWLLRTFFLGSPGVSCNFEKFHHHQKVPHPIQQPPGEVGWAPLTTFSQSHVQATSCSELQSLGTFKWGNSFLGDLDVLGGALILADNLELLMFPSSFFSWSSKSGVHLPPQDVTFATKQL